MTLTELIDKARELAPADQVRLAQELLDGSDKPQEADPVVDTAWHVELHRRIDEIENDHARLLDGRETLRIAHDRIAQRRAQSLA